MESLNHDTIAAIATPAGKGGLAVIRVSGKQALEICNRIWRGKSLRDAVSHTVHLGYIVSPSGEVIDQCVATVYKSPKSFTGEDTVEFSVHASPLIQREVMSLLIDAGARAADRGEYSQRAFINGKLDLAQAEGIADLINASSKAAHRLAISQTRGEFSKQITLLTDKLINFASLIELELDFSEEDVEFANRESLLSLCEETLSYVDNLAKSYKAGKVFKEGIPTVIAGLPNSGKSTLTNLLFGEEKAIVSDIPGTTRDIIEDTTLIDDIMFRISDTAGLHSTSDIVEKLGIEKARKRISESSIILWVADITAPIEPQISELKNLTQNIRDISVLILINKIDCISESESERYVKQIKIALPVISPEDILLISAKQNKGVDTLKKIMVEKASSGYDPNQDLIVTNARHYDSLIKASESLQQAKDGIENDISPVFIAQDIRSSITHLETITGQITTDTLLQNIFQHFCIGK